MSKSKPKPSPPLLSILPEEITAQIVTEVIQDIVDATIIDDYDDDSITRRTVVGQYRSLLLTCKLFHNIVQEFNMAGIWLAPDTRYLVACQWRSNEEDCPRKFDRPARKYTSLSEFLQEWQMETLFQVLWAYETDVDPLIAATGNFHLNPKLSLRTIYSVFEDEISRLLRKLGRFFQLHRQSISGACTKVQKGFFNDRRWIFPLQVGKVC
jgi:hypothetical protein